MALGPSRVKEWGCQWWFHGFGSFQGQGMGLSVLICVLRSFQGKGMGCQLWFHGLGSLQDKGMGLSVVIPWPQVLPGLWREGVSGGFYGLGSFQGYGMVLVSADPCPQVLPGSRSWSGQ